MTKVASVATDDSGQVDAVDNPARCRLCDVRTMRFALAQATVVPCECDSRRPVHVKCLQNFREDRNAAVVCPDCSSDYVLKQVSSKSLDVVTYDKASALAVAIIGSSVIMLVQFLVCQCMDLLALMIKIAISAFLWQYISLAAPAIVWGWCPCSHAIFGMGAAVFAVLDLGVRVATLKSAASEEWHLKHHIPCDNKSL